MSSHDRDVLESLKFELEFLQQGGYGRSVRAPGKPTSIFQDSLTCLNFGDPLRTRPCNECILWEFVPPERRGESVPCHHIPLNQASETIESLDRGDNQAGMEQAVEEWLRATVGRLEREQRESPAQIPGKKVLIVDDDEQVLMTLEALLEEAGYDTATAWGASEGQELLRARNFDVCLGRQLPAGPGFGSNAETVAARRAATRMTGGGAGKGGVPCRSGNTL